MVVFACNNCGESLKKVQVMNHLSFGKCYGFSVSCMDCQRDFDKMSHVQHIQCITEQEKYSGGNYRMKTSTLNSQRKRDEWSQLIARVAADRSSHRSRNEQTLLDFLNSLPSVPTKVKAFKALIANGARSHMSAAESVWLMLEKERDASMMKSQQQQPNKPAQNIVVETLENHSEKIEEEIPKKKKNKESKNKKAKITNENTDQMSKQSEIAPEENGVKKSKKVKLQNDEDEVVEKKSKKKKEEKDVNGTEENGHENGEVKKSKKKRKIDECEESSSKKVKLNEPEMEGDKFSWKQAILDIMTVKENISMKKLRRKVIAKYQDQPQVKELSDEKLDSKFNKALNKMSSVKVENDKVVLIQ